MEFVLLLPSIVLAVLIGSTASAVRRAHRQVRAAAVLGRTDDLDHYELAYLAGGPRRVINTVIGLLAARDLVRVSRGGRVTTVSGGPASSWDAVEQAVLDEAGAPGGRTAGEIRHAVGASAAMTGLTHRLIGRGLLLPEGALSGPRAVNERLRALVIVAAVFEGVGIVTLAAGLVEATPFSILSVIILGLSGVLGLISNARHSRSLRGPLTTTGLSVLQGARSRHQRGATNGMGYRDLAHAYDHAPHGSGYPGGPAGEAAAYAAVAGAVALYGLGELGDADVAAEISQEEARRAASGGSCASGVCGGTIGATGSSSGDSGSGGWGCGSAGGGDFGGGDFGGGSSGGGSSSCGGSSGCGGGGGGCGGGS